MPKIALVRVVGFSHAEQHALNSLLRISQQRSPSFALWTVDAEREPSILLVDAQHPHASSFAQHRSDPQAKVLWVGAEPHIFAWRSYQRPISRVKILRGMDDAYSATHAQIDSDYQQSEPINFDSTGPGLQALAPAPTPRPVRKRVLVVDDDQTARLYLKAKLLLAGPVADIDQASSGVVDRMRASLAGADAFLSKPPHPAKLKDLISSL